MGEITGPEQSIDPNGVSEIMNLVGARSTKEKAAASKETKDVLSGKPRTPMGDDLFPLGCEMFVTSPCNENRCATCGYTFGEHSRRVRDSFLSWEKKDKAASQSKTKATPGASSAKGAKSKTKTPAKETPAESAAVDDRKMRITLALMEHVADFLKTREGLWWGQGNSYNREAQVETFTACMMRAVVAVDRLNLRDDSTQGRL